MSTFLFDKIIFGPVKSRRLGNSLGINLLPTNRKVCNFDCVYCECGLNGQRGEGPAKLPTRDDVYYALAEFLKEAGRKGIQIDTITFAGNGEPTLHKHFPEIISDTLQLRDTYLPGARIAVLSNATLLMRSGIRNALNKIDYNILKLDSAIPSTVELMNCPHDDFSLSKLMEELKQFRKGLIIQTLFVRGEYRGKKFDNTSAVELEAWLMYLDEIRPESVMIYTIARDTPINTIEKIDAAKLNDIAVMVRKLGIPATVSS